MLPDVADGGQGAVVSGYVAAALGGALGALARWGVAEALPRDTGGWPWATLLVNVLGCLVLGLLIGRVFQRSPDPSWLRPFLGTGVLGGFTTYSAFAVETVQLAEAGRAGTAAAYVLASVIAGVLATALGLRAGRSAREPAP
ncbi:CrcB protein [Blastococcus aurantiacus]|uniref:Fluoride-specific ion channel FluC n=1 Tax=Blastococcus aurantiacus TaxID=1550231 RepID=A0A1G7QR74_9ACTN|nr:fluoride efflux transporter CrcB [Blastococcus aurantiacus]SDG00150.1 CrcB protein [Blastococcus aurantiacus]